MHRKKKCPSFYSASLWHLTWFFRTTVLFYFQILLISKDSFSSGLDRSSSSSPSSLLVASSLYSHFIYHFYIADSQVDCSCLDFSPPHSWNFTCVLYIAIGVAKRNFNSTCLKTIFFFLLLLPQLPCSPKSEPLGNLWLSVSFSFWPVGLKGLSLYFQNLCQSSLPPACWCPILAGPQELSSLSPFPDFFHYAVHLLENCLCCLSKVSAWFILFPGFKNAWLLVAFKMQLAPVSTLCKTVSPPFPVVPPSLSVPLPAPCSGSTVPSILPTHCSCLSHWLWSGSFLIWPLLPWSLCWSSRAAHQVLCSISTLYTSLS